MDTDIRQVILAKLRDINMEALNDLPTRCGGYRFAVSQVCSAIEQTAVPNELWDSGKTAVELTPEDRIGEHLAATRRQFGLVA